MKKFHEFTTKDELRPTMQYIYCDGTYLIATDAHILAKIHFSHAFSSLTEVPEFYMHRDEWKKLFSINPDHFIFSNGQVTGLNIRKGSRMIAEYLIPEKFNDKVGRYPNVDGIMRQLNETAGISFMLFDLDLIGRINDGLGIEHPVATFNMDENTKFAVLTFADFNGFVILMPCYSGENYDRLGAYNRINNYTTQTAKTA